MAEQARRDAWVFSVTLRLVLSSSKAKTSRRPLSCSAQSHNFVTKIVTPSLP